MLLHNMVMPIRACSGQLNLREYSDIRFIHALTIEPCQERLQNYSAIKPAEPAKFQSPVPGHPKNTARHSASGDNQRTRAFFSEQFKQHSMHRFTIENHNPFNPAPDCFNIGFNLGNHPARNRLVLYKTGAPQQLSVPLSVGHPCQAHLQHQSGTTGVLPPVPRLSPRQMYQH